MFRNRTTRGPVRANPTLHNRRKNAATHNNKPRMMEIFLTFLLLIFIIIICTVYMGHMIPTLAETKPEPDSAADATLQFLKREHERNMVRDSPPQAVVDDDDGTTSRAKGDGSVSVVTHDDDDSNKKIHKNENENNNNNNNNGHLYPPLPALPIFQNVPEGWQALPLIEDTLKNNKPTILGIASILQRFLYEFHEQNMILSKRTAQYDKVIKTFYDLAIEYLLPFDHAYRGKSIFPVREDGSIYMSLASFREHLLKETLVGAFSNAKNPDKLYVGAIVQNCFGRVDEFGEIHTDGKPCRTGAQVVGKNKKGRDMTKVSDAPPDKNGIEEFCTDPDYKKYCDAGQIRALYVHETESLGPAMARYYASKLWGGETYFVQTDSHLKFAEHWDEKYIQEVKATTNYPKSVLSSYPPGFSENNMDSKVRETKGARLCSCVFSDSDVENQIIRINTGTPYSGNEKRPTQVPFIAAGFFFVHASFLTDVPFDPLMPWCFMGEEIALSLRAWTSGWDIYAPRKNLIGHQYRPGRMGLPKFWGSINRLYGNPGMNNHLQGRVIDRVKNLVGYEESTKEIIENRGDGIILTENEHYGLGNERTLEQYMTWTGIDVENRKCPRMRWCNHGELD